MARDLVAVSLGELAVLVSTASTLNGKSPALVAFPEITPLLPSSRPGGRGLDPAARDHTYGGCPAAVWSVAEYDVCDTR